MAAPIGAISPAEKGVLGLYGKVVGDGGIEYGYLIADEEGCLRWVSRDDALALKEV